MLHNGLLDLMNPSTCFGHYYAHHQELATIQTIQRMAPHLGYGRLLVWCMAVGFWSVRLEGCFTTWVCLL